MATIILLTISNVFMTFAWYGHLKYTNRSLWLVIAASWLIALPEYCFQVPANRIGHRTFSAAQLKVMQEVITLVVFTCFAVLYLKEPIRWNYVLGFFFLLVAVYCVFGLGGDEKKEPGKAGAAAVRGAEDVSPGGGSVG